MPYISPSARLDLKYREPITAGELNYAITMLCNNYLKHRGEKSYTTLNEVVGVLECAKQELYRRLAVPYEEKKCQQNGDVYEG